MEACLSVSAWAAEEAEESSSPELAEALIESLDVLASLVEELW